jgi:hypothetical protein
MLPRPPLIETPRPPEPSLTDPVSSAESVPVAQGTGLVIVGSGKEPPAGREIECLGPRVEVATSDPAKIGTIEARSYRTDSPIAEPTPLIDGRTVGSGTYGHPFCVVYVAG